MTNKPTRTALICVDVQVDFCEGGSLAVTGGKQVAADVLTRIRQQGWDYDLIVATKDWHVDPGEHWSEEPDFAGSWPVHCAAYSHGSELAEPLRDDLFDAVFHKGEHEAAYSGFEGFLRGTEVSLVDWLTEHGITHVEVCGLATEYCVKATALDAAKAGFATTLLQRLSAGITPEGVETALVEMAAAGVTIWP